MPELQTQSRCFWAYQGVTEVRYSFLVVPMQLVCSRISVSEHVLAPVFFPEQRVKVFVNKEIISLHQGIRDETHVVAMSLFHSKLLPIPWEIVVQWRSSASALQFRSFAEHVARCREVMSICHMHSKKSLKNVDPKSGKFHEIAVYSTF